MQQTEVPTVHPVARVHETVGLGVVGAVVVVLVHLEAAPVLQQVANDAGNVLGVVQAAVRAPLKLQPQVQQHLVQVEALAVVEVAIGLAQVDPAVPPPGQWQLADLTLLAEKTLNVPGSDNRQIIHRV